MKKFTAFLAIAVLTISLCAQDAAPAAPKTVKGRGPGKRPPQQQMLENMKKSAEKLLALYDANKNGALDEDEAAVLKHDLEVMAKLQPHMRTLRVLQQIDTNQNLVIEPEEAAKMKDVIGKMRGQERGPKGKPGAEPPARPADGEEPPAPPADGEEPPAPPAEE